MNVLQRAVAAVAVSGCAVAGAHAVDVVTSIGIDYKNLDMSFEQDVRVRPASGSNPQLDGRLRQNIDFQSWQPFLQATAAIISGDYYIAVNGDTDVLDEGTDVDLNQQRSPGLAYNSATPSIDEDVDINRDDLGITLGWRGIERVALFVGFKYGKTDFDGDSASWEFIAHGPLAGASYSLPIDNGVLTLGGAVARMSATFDQDNSDERLSDQLLSEKIDADANGFSAFINWSAPLGDSLRYLVELRWQRYDFDGGDSTVCVSCANALALGESLRADKDFSVRETVYGVGISLVYAL